MDISMDGRGRCLDNIFIERLWRSVKYEEVYLKDYQHYTEAQQSLSRYFGITTTSGRTRRWSIAPQRRSMGRAQEHEVEYS